MAEVDLERLGEVYRRYGIASLVVFGSSAREGVARRRDQPPAAMDGYPARAASYAAAWSGVRPRATRSTIVPSR